MHDERVLDEIEHSIQEAGEAADTGAIAVGNEQQGDHRTAGDAASLRHMIEPQLMQQDGKRKHQGDIDQHACRELDAACIKKKQNQQ